jgi:hypothetical protein
MRAILGPSSHHASSFGVDRKKRTAGILVIAALLALLLKAFLPPESVQLQCAGKMSSKYGPGPATVFVDLKRPSWALREWHSARGSLRLELPQVAVVHYEIVRDDGDLLEIVLADEGRSAGTFSMSTGELTLHTPQGRFLGACQSRGS